MIRKFNRYELKYLLAFPEFLSVREEILRHMRVDSHARPDGRYPITSLYYDSRDLSCYQNKRDGIKYRRKLRMRVYDRTSGFSGVFVEIKQRIDRTVQKRRIQLDLETAQRLCSGEEISLSGRDRTDRETASEVRFMVAALRLQPACIIAYRREPFEGNRFDRGLRVTFDHLLSYRRHALDLELSSFNRPALHPSLVVMEIKINERIPAWLRAIMVNHESHLDRVSKYCMGIKAGLTALQFQRIQSFI